MTARIIDGKARADSPHADIKRTVAARVAAGMPPPGLRSCWSATMRRRRSTSATSGGRPRRSACARSRTTSRRRRRRPTLLALIDALNADPAVSGILVQLPLPKHIDEALVTERIDPRKDVDGFHPYNIGRLVLKRPALRPCTPYGCMTLLKDTGEDLVGKHAVVIGQSNIVGRPMALELLMERCTVTICHSKTRDLPGLVRQADIVVAGVGKAELRAGRLGEGGRDRDRRRHQSRRRRQALRRRRFRGGQRARVVDHAGAGRRRADDDRDAARQHAARGRAAGRHAASGTRSAASAAVVSGDEQRPQRCRTGGRRQQMLERVPAIRPRVAPRSPDPRIRPTFASAYHARPTPREWNRCPCA